MITTDHGPQYEQETEPIIDAVLTQPSDADLPDIRNQPNQPRQCHF